MKKLKITAIVVTLLSMFAACSTDDSSSNQSVESSQPKAIDFSTYLGRSTATSTTRSSIYSNSNLGATGVGVYAMHVTGEFYHPSLTDKRVEDFTVVNNFNHNFMDNVKVWDMNNDGAWAYNPIRYWPSGKNELVSFLAYGPYDSNNKLYTKTVETTTTENADGTKTTTETQTFSEGGANPVYIKYEISDDPSKHIDLLWNYNNTRNMQLRSDRFYEDGGYISQYEYDNWDGNNPTSQRTDDQWKPADKDTYPGVKYPDVDGNGNIVLSTAYYFEVMLKMAHACSRIAYTITSPALENDNNFADNATESNTQIVVNKLVLLGDAKSATDAAPKGVFTKSGYLNITNTSKTGMWEGLGDDKVAFSFDKFYDGTYVSNRTPNIWIPEASSTDKENGENNTIKSTKDADGKITVNTIGNASDGYLFVIPQDLSLTEEEEDNLFNYDKTNLLIDGRPLYCYIDYTVKYKDGTEVEQNHKCYGFISQKFEAGKAYVIHIQIGRKDGGSTSYPTTDLNAIHFSVTTDDWDNEKETNAFSGVEYEGEITYDENGDPVGDGKHTGL